MTPIIILKKINLHHDRISEKESSPFSNLSFKNAIRESNFEAIYDRQYIYGDDIANYFKINGIFCFLRFMQIAESWINQKAIDLEDPLNTVDASSTSEIITKDELEEYLSSLLEFVEQTVINTLTTLFGTDHWEGNWADLESGKIRGTAEIHADCPLIHGYRKEVVDNSYKITSAKTGSSNEDDAPPPPDFTVESVDCETYYKVIEQGYDFAQEAVPKIRDRHGILHVDGITIHLVYFENKYRYGHSQKNNRYTFSFIKKSDFDSLDFSFSDENRHWDKDINQWLVTANIGDEETFYECVDYDIVAKKHFITFTIETNEDPPSTIADGFNVYYSYKVIGTKTFTAENGFPDISTDDEIHSLFEAEAQSGFEDENLFNKDDEPVTLPSEINSFIKIPGEYEKDRTSYWHGSCRILGCINYNLKPEAYVKIRMSKISRDPRYSQDTNIWQFFTLENGEYIPLNEIKIPDREDVEFSEAGKGCVSAEYFLDLDNPTNSGAAFCRDSSKPMYEGGITCLIEESKYFGENNKFSVTEKIPIYRVPYEKEIAAARYDGDITIKCLGAACTLHDHTKTPDPSESTDTMEFIKAGKLGIPSTLKYYKLGSTYPITQLNQMEMSHSGPSEITLSGYKYEIGSGRYFSEEEHNIIFRRLGEMGINENGIVFAYDCNLYPSTLVRFLSSSTASEPECTLTAEYNDYVPKDEIPVELFDNLINNASLTNAWGEEVSMLIPGRTNVTQYQWISQTDSETYMSSSVGPITKDRTLYPNVVGTFSYLDDNFAHYLYVPLKVTEVVSCSVPITATFNINEPEIVYNNTQHTIITRNLMEDSSEEIRKFTYYKGSQIQDPHGEDVLIEKYPDQDSHEQLIAVVTHDGPQSIGRLTDGVILTLNMSDIFHADVTAQVTETTSRPWWYFQGIYESNDIPVKEESINFVSMNEIEGTDSQEKINLIIEVEKTFELPLAFGCTSWVTIPFDIS